MVRGHQRHSYPFDKMVPRTIGEKVKLGDTTAAGRGVKKHMHIKKQRQYNRVLENKLKSGQPDEVLGDAFKSGGGLQLG